MRTIGERIGSPMEMYDRMGENWAANLRVSIPGIVQSFDIDEQTVTVQPAIRERIIEENGTVKYVALPELLNVPIVFPRSGGFVLTMPVKKGDECLVVFADMCIDAWWSSGGIQNQIEKRRHDLSDAFAIMGTWSQPRKIPNYSINSAQLRSDDGNQRIEISESSVNLVGNVKHNNEDLGTSQPGSGNIDGGSFI